MKLSTRNQFKHSLKDHRSQEMAEVTVQVGEQQFVSAITKGSVQSMGLKQGDSVTIAVKATDVMVGN